MITLTSLCFQFLFTGVRLGLYEPVKRLFYTGVRHCSSNRSGTYDIVLHAELLPL